MPDTVPQTLTRDRYQTIAADLLGERTTYESHWKEISDFMQPRRSRFLTSDRNKGGKKNQNIVDGSALFPIRTLESGMHAGLTSPARPWFHLTTPDPSLAEHGNVKTFLHTVRQRMSTVFLQSNLYNALPIVYGDMGCYGTAAIGVLPDEKDVLRCYTYPVGSYAVGLDDRNKVSSFVRTYQLSVRQVVQQFGGTGGTRIKVGQMIDWSNISTTVRSLWNDGKYSAAVELRWLVMPNDDANPKRLEARFLPFKSCHFEMEATGDIALRESGFKTFPIMLPRWEVRGEDFYGNNCPGMTALGDVKQLMAEQKKKGQLLAKVVDPPLKGPSILRTQKVSLLPADISYVDVRDGMQGLAPIHEIRLDGYQYLLQDIGEVQYRIKRAFYEDLFLMLQQDPQLGADRPTAREVEERHEEKLFALGPVLERTNDELLDPLIDRAFQIMLDAGLIPDPPQELEGLNLRVEYTSILAEAQKLVGVSALDRLMQTSVALMEHFPEVRHKLDIYRVMDTYGDILGNDPRIIRSTADAEQSMAQQAQQQQAVEQAKQAQQLGQAVKAAGTTPMDGDTALTRILTGIQSSGPANSPAAGGV